MLEANDVNEEMAKLLASGVLEMTMVLATVTGRFEEWLKALSTPIH